MDPVSIALAVFGLALGGTLKGAIGAGAPVIAVPILALLYDVPTAVALFSFPNILSNAWQGWAFREHQISPRFVWSYALGGALGAGIGSVILATLSSETLMAGVALMVFVYVAFRLFRPGWALSRSTGTMLALPMGTLGGLMQGAGGISAPVSVTFLNSMRLERSEFIATIAIFFLAMGLVQVPALSALGIMTPERAVLSLLAAIPLFGAMPLGAWLARRISREAFDKIVLVLLVVIALRLLFAAFG